MNNLSRRIKMPRKDENTADPITQFPLVLQTSKQKCPCSNQTLYIHIFAFIYCFLSVISGITPLHAAIGNRDLQTTQLLLRYNASVAAKAMIRHKRQEERLCDPFEMAVDLLQWDIVNLLTEYGYNLSQHEYLRDSVFYDTIPAALKNDPSMFALLQETARKPPSLQKLVVLRVRDILKIDIPNKVQSLSLPNSLKSDISMVEIS